LLNTNTLIITYALRLIHMYTIYMSTFSQVFQRRV